MSKLCPTEVMHEKRDGKPVFVDVEHCLIAKFALIKVLLCAFDTETKSLHVCIVTNA